MLILKRERVMMTILRVGSSGWFSETSRPALGPIPLKGIPLCSEKLSLKMAEDSRNVLEIVLFNGVCLLLHVQFIS